MGIESEEDWSEATIMDKNEITKEVKQQLKLAGPLMIVTFLLFSLNVISIMFVGHLDQLQLAGTSLATAFAVVTGYSFLIGMSYSLDTFCGQSYGAKQYKMLGIHMQRAMLMLLCVSLPIAFIWYNTSHILILMRQDREISAQAGIYARYMIPSIFAYGLLLCHMKFLLAQNIVFPMMLTTGFTTLLHVPVCWLLVFKSGLGSRGAALSNAISDWLNLLLLAGYVRLSPSCKETWTGFSKEAFYCLPEFLKLAVPGAFMCCLEIWAFDGLVVVAGFLPNPKLETSVLSISLNISATIFMLQLGLGGAVSTRVSNELGAGKPQLAKRAVCVSMMMGVIEGISVACLLILGRNLLARCYSNEKEVVKSVAQMMLLVAASHFVNGIQTVLTGIVRGCGWQRIGAFINVGAYYLAGIPCAILFAFVCHLKGKGLWMGIIVALLIQASLFLIISLRTNWDNEAKKATDRLDKATVN